MALLMKAVGRIVLLALWVIVITLALLLSIWSYIYYVMGAMVG